MIFFGRAIDAANSADVIFFIRGTGTDCASDNTPGTFVIGLTTSTTAFATDLSPAFPRVADLPDVGKDATAGVFTVGLTGAGTADFATDFATGFATGFATDFAVDLATDFSAGLMSLMTDAVLDGAGFEATFFVALVSGARATDDAALPLVGAFLITAFALTGRADFDTIGFIGLTGLRASLGEGAFFNVDLLGLVGCFLPRRFGEIFSTLLLLATVAWPFLTKAPALVAWV